MYKSRTIFSWLCLISTLFLSACGILDVSRTTSPEQIASVERNVVAEKGDKKAAEKIAALEPRAGDPTLTPALGLKTEKLFNYPVYNEDKRFERLEDNVQNMRDEINKILPVISTQLAIQGDVKGLVDKLNNMVPPGSTLPKPVMGNVAIKQPPNKVETVPLSQGGNRASEILKNLNKNKVSGGSVAVSSPQATAKAANKKPGASASSAPSSGGAKLVAVRASDHAGKTRIVLETKDKINFDAALGSDGKTLIITPSGGCYDSKLKNMSLGSVNVSGASISDVDTNGYRVELGLKQSVQIDKKLLLSPNSTNPNYRTTIDLVF